MCRTTTSPSAPQQHLIVGGATHGRHGLTHSTNRSCLSQQDVANAELGKSVGLAFESPKQNSPARFRISSTDVGLRFRDTSAPNLATSSVMGGARFVDGRQSPCAFRCSKQNAQFLSGVVTFGSSNVVLCCKMNHLPEARREKWPHPAESLGQSLGHRGLSPRDD